MKVRNLFADYIFRVLEKLLALYLSYLFLRVMVFVIMAFFGASNDERRESTNGLDMLTGSMISNLRLNCSAPEDRSKLFAVSGCLTDDDRGNVYIVDVVGAGQNLVRILSVGYQPANPMSFADFSKRYRGFVRPGEAEYAKYAERFAMQKP